MSRHSSSRRCTRASSGRSAVAVSSRATQSTRVEKSATIAGPRRWRWPAASMAGRPRSPMPQQAAYPGLTIELLPGAEKGAARLDLAHFPDDLANAQPEPVPATGRHPGERPSIPERVEYPAELRVVGHERAGQHDLLAAPAGPQKHPPEGTPPGVPRGPYWGV